MNLLSLGMQALNEEDNLRQRRRLETERFLADPANSSKLISHIARTIVPEKKLTKLGANATLEKVLNAIPEDDPRGPILAKTMQDAGDYVRSHNYINPKQAVMDLYNQNLDDNKVEVFKAMQRGYSGIGNSLRKMVGIKPTDEYAPMTGYDEWKKADDLAHPTENRYTNPLLSMALGAMPKAIGLGAEKMVQKGATNFAVRVAAKYLGRGLLMQPHPLGKVAGAALMAIPEFLAFDVASNAVRNSEWARNRSDLKVLAAEGLAGLASGVGFAKGTGLIKKFMASKNTLSEIAEQVAARPSSETILKFADVERQFNKDSSLLKRWRETGLHPSEMSPIGPEDFAESSWGGSGGIGGVARPPMSSNLDFSNAVDTITNATNKSVEEALGMAQAQEMIYTSSMYKKAMQAAPENPEKLKLFNSILGKNVSSDTTGWIKEGNVLKNTATKEEVEVNKLTSGRKLVVPVRGSEIDKLLNKLEPGFNEVSSSSSLLKDAKAVEAAKSDPIVARRLVDNAFAESRINNMGARLTKLSEADKQHLGQLRVDFMVHDPESKNILYSAPGEHIDPYGEKVAAEVRNRTKDMITTNVKHIPLPKAKELSPEAMYRKEVFSKNIELFGKGKDLPQTEHFKPMMEALDALENFDFDNPAIAKARKMGIYLPITELEKNKEMISPFMKSKLSSITLKDATDIINGKASLGEIGDIEKGFLNVETGEEVWKELISRAKSGKYDGGKNGGKLLSLALATAGTIPLVSLLGEKESEAGVIDTAGRMVSKYTVEMMNSAAKTGGKSMMDVAKEWIDRGYVVLAPKPGQTTLNNLQKQIIVTPDVTNLVMEQAKNPLGWKRYFTKGFQADWLYGTFNPETGRLNMTSPIVQLSHAMQCAQINTKYGLEVVDNILKGIPSHAKEVESALKPLYDKYYDMSPKLGALKTNIGNLEGLISKTEKRLLSKRISPEAREALEGQLENFKKSLTENQIGLNELTPQFDALKNEYDPIIKSLAQKYPGVRIKLAARGYGMEEGNAWLNGMLSQEERVAAGHIRKFLDDLVPHIEQAGERPLLREPYVPFGTPTSVNWETQAAKAGNIQLFGKDAFPLAHLNTRMLYGLDMLPDIRYSMEKYIPDVMKRMQLAEFWKEGQIGGWAEHALQVRKMGLRGAEEFWNGVKDSLKPQLNTPVNKMVRQLYAFESMIRLALSPAVALKHAVKMESTWSMAGFGHGMQVMPRTMKAYYNNVASDLSHVITGKRNDLNFIDAAADALSNQNRMTAVISDMNLYEPPSTWWERLMDKMNEKGAMLVANTERFDRFHATMAAMDMAAKQGMTAEQATYGVMDTIMRNNFLSGNFNPSWLQNPKTRLLMMFQGTPFKILEQRMLLAMRSGKSFASSAGKTWELLQGLRGDIKEGEALVKAGLIKDALATDKDIFGNPYTHQLMRKAMILGTMMLGGRMLFDSDLSGHALHFPGIKVEGGAKLSLNPFVNAALQAKPKEDEFWLSAFFKKWLPAGPIPMMLHKAIRLNDDDIPKIYKDSNLAYLFSIPQVKDKE